MVELVTTRINQDLSPDLYADLITAQTAVTEHRRTIGELEHNLELSRQETIREQNAHNQTRTSAAELLSNCEGRVSAAEDAHTDTRLRLEDMAVRLEGLARLATSSWLNGEMISPEELRAVLKAP
jgi:DNA repair exonuclease SbcCD ATPase subunit